MVRVFVGHDPREPQSYEVCVRSLLLTARKRLEIHPLVTAHLRGLGVYWRPHQVRQVEAGQQLWDPVSGAPMSTEFAVTRFLVPFLAPGGFSLFCDADFLWRADVQTILDDIPVDEVHQRALWVVKHEYLPTETTKMDGQAQTAYSRKNWSSLMLFNPLHPAWRRLTLEMVNELPGRDLHRFCWLDDDEIGSLPVRWNWLEGHSDEAIDPAAVHFTRGTPELPGWEDTRYADEWRAVLGDDLGAA